METAFSTSAYSSLAVQDTIACGEIIRPDLKRLSEDLSPHARLTLNFALGLKQFGSHDSIPVYDPDSFPHGPFVFMNDLITQKVFGKDEERCIDPIYKAREIDSEIEKIVRSELERCDATQTLSVLEVAAGTSYPSSSKKSGSWVEHISAPWLSRHLQQTYRSDPRFSLVATDCGGVKPGELAVILRKAPEGWVQSFGASLGIDELKFGPGAIVRPYLDPEIEMNAFGLRAINGVNLFELGLHFKKGAFDLIFARHLPPEDDQFVWRFEPLVPFLKPGGRIIAEIDQEVTSETGKGFIYRYQRS